MIGLAQWLPALLICLALAGVAWRLRAQAPPPGQAQLQTLASTALGPSQRVVAVRAAGRVLLLTICARGVSLVGEMRFEEWLAADAEPLKARAAGRGETG